MMYVDNIDAREVGNMHPHYVMLTNYIANWSDQSALKVSIGHFRRKSLNVN